MFSIKNAMNDTQLTREKQTAMIQHVTENKFSRVVFQAFKEDSVNHNTYLPRVGLTMGQYFTYDVVAKSAK